LLSSIFDFSNPADFVDLITNLQKYATEIMTSIDVSQMYSFLNDGLSFIKMETVGNQVNAEANNVDYQYKYKYESANLDIENKPSVETTDPLVYIYNTHTAESYESDEVNATLGSKVTVVDTSKQISLALDTYGVKSVVEMRDVADVLAANSWNYY
ncbi:MAG TPA: stage II sporulation protein P, partial [Firmicutes bacterium]|nr:stage II sporulation protein P [Bacillota bacterium]